MPEPFVIITCEHGGHSIPYRYEALFEPHRDLVKTHRGWDIGAWDMAYIIAEGLDASIFTTTVTRLLIDCNRSPGHPRLFSDITKPLKSYKQRDIVDLYYTPFREPVEKTVADTIAKGRPILHLSVHSFTPVLDGVTRQCDIGLLYNPVRGSERAFAEHLHRDMASLLPDKRIRRNFPYRGTADGFTSYLRKRHDGAMYRGIEIEFNQKWALRVLTWRRMGETVVEAVRRALEEW